MYEQQTKLYSKPCVFQILRLCLDLQYKYYMTINLTTIQACTDWEQTLTEKKSRLRLAGVARSSGRTAVSGNDIIAAAFMETILHQLINIIWKKSL